MQLEHCCANCRYWNEKTEPEFNEDGTVPSTGECRKNPPVLVPKDDMVFTMFPTTPATQWCGQYNGCGNSGSTGPR